MKDEPWRFDPHLKIKHQQRKLANKRVRIRELEARVAELESAVESAYREGWDEAANWWEANTVHKQRQYETDWKQSAAKAALAARNSK